MSSRCRDGFKYQKLGKLIIEYTDLSQEEGPYRGPTLPTNLLRPITLPLATSCSSYTGGFCARSWRPWVPAAYIARQSTVNRQAIYPLLRTSSERMQGQRAHSLGNIHNVAVPSPSHALMTTRPQDSKCPPLGRSHPPKPLLLVIHKLLAGPLTNLGNTFPPQNVELPSPIYTASRLTHTQLTGASKKCGSQT